MGGGNQKQHHAVQERNHHLHAHGHAEGHARPVQQHQPGRQRTPEIPAHQGQALAFAPLGRKPIGQADQPNAERQRYKGIAQPEYIVPPALPQKAEQVERRQQHQIGRNAGPPFCGRDTIHESLSSSNRQSAGGFPHNAALSSLCLISFINYSRFFHFAQQLFHALTKIKRAVLPVRLRSAQNKKSRGRPCRGGGCEQALCFLYASPAPAGEGEDRAGVQEKLRGIPEKRENDQ